MRLAAATIFTTGLLLTGCTSSSSTPVTSPAPATSATTITPGTVVSGEQVYTGLTREHVDGAVAYPQSPPVGGNHNPVWVPCDGKVYDAPVPNEKAVHSMEHGGVWLTWAPTLAKADVEKLHALVQGIDYRFGSPYPSLTAPIVVTAWGHQMTATSPDDARIATFLAAYTHGPQTPEEGAPCSGGDDAMAPHVDATP